LDKSSLLDNSFWSLTDTDHYNFFKRNFVVQQEQALALWKKICSKKCIINSLCRVSL
jgi:hypothetical protein